MAAALPVGFHIRWDFTLCSCKGAHWSLREFQGAWRLAHGLVRMVAGARFGALASAVTTIETGGFPMMRILRALHEFLASARTYIFLSTMLSGAVALHWLNEAQADAIQKAAAELGIAFFGVTWTYSVGQRDIGM